MAAPESGPRLGEDAERFGLIKLFLKICGISLRRNEGLFYRLYSTVMLSANLYPLFQLIGVNRYLAKESEVFEFWIFEAITALILIKVVVLVYNRMFMGAILEKLQSGVFRPNAARGGITEEILIRDCIRVTNRQAKLYWSIVTWNVCFTFFDAGYSRIRSDDYNEWRFACGRVTVFNTSYSPNYELAVLYQNLSWFPMGWTFAVSDLLTVTVLAHITCQLKILQNAIGRIVPNSYVKMIKDQGMGFVKEMHASKMVDTSEIPWRYLKPVVKDVVEYHLAILEIAKQIETAFNLLVLLIILSGIVLIGSLLYRLNGMHVGGTMCFLCEIILICYWGNEVTLESQKLTEACYKVNFPGADLRLQKAIILMMERSKRPIVFTAGKFSPLTLGTFIWIARATYSYLMILRSINNK